MAVRSADPHRDAAACAAIYAPYVRDSWATFQEAPPTPREMADRMLLVTMTHPWLVDEREGAVTGYAYGATHRARAGYRWTVEVAVYVEPDRRGQGIGRALYDELLTRLRAQGFRRALAGIALPNDASVALHESVGFTPLGVFREVGFKDGVWRDVGWWQLDLAPGAPDPPPEPRPPAP